MNKNTLQKAIEKFIGYTLIFIGYFIPKKHIYLFAGQHGKRAFDNSKYLFDYFINQNNQNIQIYWFYTTETKELELIPEIYRIKAHSLKGFLLSLQAKAAFVSYTAADFGLIRFNKKTTFIQLWHGIPLKTIFYGVKYSSLKTQLSYKIELSRYSYFVASSDIESDILQKQLKIPKTRILQSGYPRNDILKTINIPSSPTIKNILFAPTFRETGFSPIQSLTDKDWEKLSSLLLQHNIILTIRSHAVEFFKDTNPIIQSKLSNNPNIVFANSDEHPDVQQLMLNSDCLISDYSGIIIDYLLLEKPIIRFMPDYTNYSDFRGLNEYNIYLGQTALNSEELLLELINIIKSPDCFYQNLHQSKTILHNQYYACPAIYSWSTSNNPFSPIA